MKRYCTQCYRFESETCQHTWVKVPDKCKCDVGEWAPNLKSLPPICNRYKGTGKSVCRTCSHDKECHE